MRKNINEIWMSKTVTGLVPGDLIVLTEGTPAALPSSHYLRMAQAIGREVSKSVPGITVVVCTRGNSVDRLDPKMRDHLVESWLKTISSQEQDKEMHQLATRLLQLANRKKVGGKLLEL